MTMTKYLFILLFTLSVFTQAQNVLIKNGTILTVSQGTKENTDILVTNGKITRIDKNITAPSGVQVIDAKGLFVMFLFTGL